MDIKHNPFTPGIVMTAPGGLDYLKMPMGLMQAGPGGPGGQFSVHTVSPSPGGPHSIAVMPASAINISGTHFGKVISTAGGTNAPGTVTMVHAGLQNVNTTSSLSNSNPATTSNPITAGEKRDSTTTVTVTSSTPTIIPNPDSSALIISQPKYVCEICNKGFKSGYNLKRHSKDYHGENSEIIKAKASHICALCAKPFLSSHNLKRHSQDFHSDNRLTYHCEVCRKNFQNRFNLKRHRIGIHSGPGGQFQCEICSKFFHYQSNLSRHRKDVHKSGPGFPGTTVVLHASHKTTVKKQLMALPSVLTQAQPQQLQTQHPLQSTQQCQQVSPNKTFLCDLCHKDFQNTYNLKRHRVNVHKETKILYRCDECGKDFPSIGNFKRHKNLVHGLGKQAFHCESCDKNFASKDGLKRHISAIHENTEGAYACETCGKNFKRKDYLANHRVSTHDNKYTIIPADTSTGAPVVDSTIITSSSNIC